MTNIDGKEVAMTMSDQRKSPAFSFYPDSWIGGTRRMSLLEKGIYIELLSDQWCNGGFSIDMAARICSESDRSIVEAVVRAKFTQSADGLWRNSRLEQERESQEKRRKTQQENGKKGGRPKLEKNPEITNGFNLGLQNENPNETQTEPKKNPSVSVSVSVSDTVSVSDSVSKTGDPQTPKGVSVAVQDFLDRWNKFAARTPKVSPVRKMTSKRRDALSTRLKTAGWLEDFREAVKCLPLPGDGWQPNLDWLIRNDHNIYLLLEGAYDWRGKDDPASQRLAIQRRKEAFAQREAREAAEKKARAADVSGTHTAMASTLSQVLGSTREESARSLLFGSEIDLSASGAES